MKYYKYGKEEIIKYDVKFDKDALEKIRLKVIEECGVREHKSYDTDYPSIMSGLFIRNYKEQKVGTVEYFEETRDVYHLEYDEIIEPELASLIHSFIYHGDFSLFDYLYGGKELDDDSLDKTLVEEISTREEQLELLAKEKPVDLESIVSLVNELKGLKEDLLISSDKKSVSLFMPSIKKCISITEVERLDIDKYNKYNCFFEKPKSKVYSLQK